MKHNILIIIFTLLLFLPSLGFTQTKEIIAEGAYNMGDGETPTVAESRALLQAKRVALEQAGTYVESYTKVKDFKLTEDEIKVLASGLMEVEIVDKKRTIVGDGFNFWVKIKASVNLDKTEEMAKRVKEKSIVEDYKKIQEAYDKSRKEIEELKNQLRTAKNEAEKKSVETRIADDERLFQANGWFEKGHKHGINNELDAAIEAFISAIALNPNYAEAYIGLGVVYGNKGQYDREIENYNKAIALNPNIALAHYNLGNAYYSKGQYDRAIENYNKAIALNPNDAEAYYALGAAYTNEGQIDKAIENLNRAIALNPKHALAYNNLGLAYVGKGQLDRAIENYNKVIALNPNLAGAYYNLGLAYAKKGDRGRVISNFQKACDMGNEVGCEGLQKALKKNK